MLTSNTKDQKKKVIIYNGASPSILGALASRRRVFCLKDCTKPTITRPAGAGRQRPQESVTPLQLGAILILVKWARRAVPLVLAVGVIAAACALIGRGPKEPAYKGKTLSEWINLYNSPLNPFIYDLFPKPYPAPEYYPRYLPIGERNRKEGEELERKRQLAADAVSQIGTNAVPILLHWLDYDMPSWKRKLAMFRDKLPHALRGGQLVDWWLIAGDHYRIDRALMGFYLLGSNAVTAVPELTRRMSTRTSQSALWAINALANMGNDGLPPLLAALANTNAPNRPHIARFMDSQLFLNLGTNARPAVQILANCVSDGDSGVAYWSIVTLGTRAIEPDICLPALIHCLDDLRPTFRGKSADSLNRFGSAALPAVPMLLAHLTDPDPYVRLSVTNALQTISPAALEMPAKQEHQ